MSRFFGALKRTHQSCVLIHMRTSLNIDEAPLERAARLSGLKEKTGVIHAGLEALIARESARRLAALGRTELRLRAVRRRRTTTTRCLVDTSPWVEHLRRGHPGLAARLEEADVATHPFVIGELAWGLLKNRREVLDLMAALPHASVADHDEVSR